MDSAPNLFQLRKLAVKQGKLIVKSPQDDLYALVIPDFQGKGTDPKGLQAAEAAFANDLGMTLEDIAAELD